MLYVSLKKSCTVALHFFFRKWQVVGTENIPSGPVIFVPNHQNAFLDAVLVACSSKKNPWFMTRSDVFKKPAVKKLLTQIKMLPVYRFRDGYKTLRQNEEVMRMCVNKIEAGETILIFAEGNHGEKFQLRPLQKGVARMAFATTPAKNISVVPVGIHYDLSRGFRSRVLVSFGKPIYVNDILKLDLPERESHEMLLEQTSTELKNLLLHIPEPDYEQKLLHIKSNRNYSTNVRQQLQNDIATLSSFSEEKSTGNVKNKKSVLNIINNKYARLNLFLSSILINKLLLKNVKDPQFANSIKFGAGMFTTPIIWIIQSFAVFSLTESITISSCYAISLPASLWFEKTS